MSLAEAGSWQTCLFKEDEHTSCELEIWNLYTKCSMLLFFLWPRITSKLIRLLIQN